MKIVKIRIQEKVLFLLSLICFTSLIQTKNNINFSLSSFKKYSDRAFSSTEKSTTINKKKSNSKNYLTLLSRRLKYTSQKLHLTKKYQKIHLKTKKSTRAFKRMMRYHARLEYFDKLTEFFHGLKEKFTGEEKDKQPETSNLSLYDQTKLKAENFLLKTIWEQTLSKVKDFEKLVQQVSFNANNPITALLFKVQEKVFKEDPNLKYEKVEKRKIPLDKEKKNEKTEEEKKGEEEAKKKEDEEKGKFQQLLDSARVKGVELIESAVTDILKGLVEKQFDGIYTGFFKTMLVEFSPIAMINIQDSVTIGEIQDQVTGAISGNAVDKSEQQLTVTVNDFINSTVDACKTYSNIKDVSRNLIQRITNFLSKNFTWFRKLIKGLNDLIKRAKGIKDVEDTPKSILKGNSEGNKRDKIKKSVKINEELNKVYEFQVDEEVTLWSQIRKTASEIWKLVKDELLMFFDAMKQCMIIYNENFLKFLPRAKLTFSISVVGGIIDGFIKSVPGVSQLIGLINSVIGIYTTWRIYTFGTIDLSIKDARKVDESQLGALIARFIASHIRGALGLLNIPGIENTLKVAYHIYLMIVDSWKKAGKDSGSTFSQVSNFILNLTGITISRETFDGYLSSLKKLFLGRKLKRYYK